MEGGEKLKKREEGSPEPAHGLQQIKQLNTLELLAGFNSVVIVEYRGETIPAACSVILAIIVNEYRNEGFCNKDVISSQFGRNSLTGNYLSILERSGLIKRLQLGQWMPTAEGEIFIRSIVTDLNRIILNKPSARFKKPPREDGAPQPHPRQKNSKGHHVRRPAPPLETFNQLVIEVLSKKGLNRKAKYALLRAIGMKVTPAKEALKQLEKGKHTERIKPILKGILSNLASDSAQNPS